MARCPQQSYFDEYISGELSQALEIEFIKHLELCPDCSRQLDSFYKTHRRLHLRKRPTAPPELIKVYQNELHAQYGRQAFLNRFGDILQAFLPRPTLWWRLAAITGLLIIGVFTGRYLLKPDPVVVSPMLQMPNDWQQPVAKADFEYIGYYLSASEIILLEMANSTATEPEIYISKETAQKLLIKTFLVHETALKLKDPRLLSFLSKMELILYELANADNERLEDSIASVQLVIDGAQLLDEVKRLQQSFYNETTG